ncbi:MAG: metal ABC transporter substrate-binding protein [Mycobacteriales bacterium]
MRHGLLLLLALTCAATACAAPPTADGRVDVVAGAYPFAWAAQQVGGDDVHVTDLVRGGGEPHDVELAPRQVGAVEQADLVVYLPGFQPAVDDAIRVTGAAALDLSGPAQVRSAGSDLADAPRGGIDPHVWLDPVRMTQIVLAVRDRLIRVDPEHATGYRGRAAAAVAELASLDGLFRVQLSGCRRTDVVTAHTAFFYLADRYGLRQVGVTGLDPDSEPTPGRVAKVARLAQQLGVTTVYFESTTSTGLARTVADEIGARTAVLDPIERVKPGEDYLSVMRRNAVALHEGLGCA